MYQYSYMLPLVIVVLIQCITLYLINKEQCDTERYKDDGKTYRKESNNRKQG